MCTFHTNDAHEDCHELPEYRGVGADLTACSSANGLCSRFPLPGLALLPACLSSGMAARIGVASELGTLALSEKGLRSPSKLRLLRS